MPIIFIFIILFIAVVMLYWYFILINPLQRAKTFDEIYSPNVLIHISVSVSVILYVVFYGALNINGVSLFIVILAVIMPPVVMLIAIFMLFWVKFYAFMISAGVLIIGCYAALRMVNLKIRFAITLLTVIPICAIPITVQGFVSIANIKLEYERLGGDCLSLGSFYQSVKFHSSSYARFHAVATKGDDAYIWSYQQARFVPSSRSKASTLLYSPNGDCRV